MESIKKPDSTILKLFLGTYEGKIITLDMDLVKKTVNIFSFKVSENSIKVIIHKDNYIFASGIDEIIHIYDMDKKQDKGTVVTYTGSISTLQIMKNYLFAAGDDHNLQIWRMTDFSKIHNLKGHKSAIVNFVLHKSGKFCLSSARDSTLIIWNLVQGRKIVKYQLKAICNKILFIKKQTLAILLYDLEIWVFDFFKNSENYEEWVLKKVKLQGGNKIIDAFTIKDSLIVLHASGAVKIYHDIVNDDLFNEITLEKPQKLNENDLEIKVKVTNISKDKKFKLLNVVYNNNEIYIYDINRILKSSKSEGGNIIAKKYFSTSLKISDRLTCVDSNIFCN